MKYKKTYTQEEYKNLVEALVDSNDTCRSMWQIVLRQGKETNWNEFTIVLGKRLNEQHRTLKEIGFY